MWSPIRLAHAAVVLTVVALALGACGSGEDPASQSTDAGGGAAAGPPGLRGLKAQANELLDGGEDAFKRRLVELRGYPVVVNQWASWCIPCREEFPFFQRLAEKYEGRVAFIGVDSKDNREDAAEFLDEFPVPYPHYFDGDASVARVFGGGRAWPTTAFYDRTGKLRQTHLGGYADEGKLEEDIREQALGG